MVVVCGCVGDGGDSSGVMVLVMGQLLGPRSH